MPSFFNFQQGTETPFADPSAPLLGRFRAVPRARANSRSLFASFGYGSIFGSVSSAGGGGSGEDFGDGDALGGGDGDEREGLGGLLVRTARSLNDVWVQPQQASVKALLNRWWTRWMLLCVLPAAVTVAWCALPFPQYRLPAAGDGDEDDGDIGKVPGHGQARVQVNFWFFLFVYYAFYNLTALVWITKVFNIYSLNWWPQSVGFPLTLAIISTVSLAVPIPIYYMPETRWFLTQNTTWIVWTFIVMAMPVGVAFAILMSHERHIGLRNSLSETQRIFTESWWTSEQDPTTVARRERRRAAMHAAAFDPAAPDGPPRPALREAARLRTLWIPASFMRFVWFCAALSVGLLAYVLGETYAEIYLRTLPHNNVETIVYVYSWIGTIHVLDGLAGWILGGEDGERVGSYPLGWIFKLYFSLTYQTYVRALYARLRRKEQFVILQLLSSTSLILLHPLTMARRYHSVLTLLGFSTQTFATYQKYAGRSIFIRTLSENASMAAFLGQVLVLHYGANRNVYPYFAFDERETRADGYDFGLTFWAACVTWACEIVAAWVVRRVVAWCWKFDVSREGRRDLWEWPELLPTSAAVMVHVLQNMLFSIIRLQFHCGGVACIQE